MFQLPMFQKPQLQLSGRNQEKMKLTGMYARVAVAGMVFLIVMFVIYPVFFLLWALLVAPVRLLHKCADKLASWLTTDRTL